MLRTREQYERLINFVPLDALELATRTLLKDYGKYFKANPETQGIDPSAFLSFFAVSHPGLKPEALAVFRAAILDSANPPPPGTEDGIRDRLISLATASKLQAALERFNDGEGDLTAELRHISEQHENWTMRKRTHPKVKDRIEDMLALEENDTGFHFRLNVLNEVLKPLWEGDFIIVAARVDSGKSTFFASELTYMAAQVPELYPDRDRPIIVFNNEGPGRKLRHRMFNAALGATNTELVAKSKAGTVYQEYVDATGDRIQIFDVHDYTMGQLEDIVKELDPCIVVIDMLDNVQADVSVATNGGTRTDQLLEWLYQRARVWAVKYKCAVIATSQLSGEADGELFPKLSMLANSKTGKAGAADAIIMLGRSSNVDLQNTRFISTPKNKKRRDGAPQDPRREVSFKGPIARFED
ncbi:DnaB-like helicase C-terminal domain-containing protein [Burkholderia multivorans]|uniref:DnaB-like helicase C-terminal domain-containing protein n=1 Tax=Burkholderia multivorans TaxID=87883 RepID=UPI0020B2A8FD|nr:DnaB-like helicase C-terminal domain-containing protein [Burkholderia multivorans]MDN7595302.1 DnaB-like helicase C-terminal domain-containing protein [Burkholderia multivorans]MDN7844484.1 DnaB-like helicase C-terminal domain-containing protein [Burkholderia multivorans]